MYKRSISNLAWSNEYDTEMYQFLSDNNYDGIEIAPSKVFGENPYSKVIEAKEYKKYIREKYNLEVSSMQSIWFGRTENIFKSKEERNILFEYTKKTIEFANILDCKNLVFGCPKNRNIQNIENVDKMYQIFIDFMYDLGEYAYSNNTIISLEANPTIYNTNFINYTMEAFEICKKINSKGIAVNLDIGTMIYNNECIFDFEKFTDLINHVHLSEPYLKKVTFSKKQIDILKFINNLNLLDKYISIEMGKIENIETLKSVIIECEKTVKEIKL